MHNDENKNPFYDYLLYSNNPTRQINKLVDSHISVTLRLISIITSFAFNLNKSTTNYELQTIQWRKGFEQKVKVSVCFL